MRPRRRSIVRGRCWCPVLSSVNPIGPSSSESFLDGAGVELDQLARFVAEHIVQLLQTPPASPAVLIDAAEVARRFGVDRGWVYAHARELGAVRLGDGRRPRLRFDPSTVAAALTRQQVCEGSDAAPEADVAAARSDARGQSAAHWTKAKSKVPTRSMRICG